MSTVGQRAISGVQAEKASPVPDTKLQTPGPAVPWHMPGSPVNLP